MSKIDTSFVNTTVPQNQPLDSTQVKNPAGGFVWKASDLDRLKRFLMLGVEGGTYYAGEPQLTEANAKIVASLAKKDGQLLVDTIVDVSVSGRSAKQDPILFALAMAATQGDNETKKLARDAMKVVCRTASQLFSFVDYYKSLGGGWGRGMRNAVADWYNSKDTKDLVYQVTKYQQRAGWTHRDLLRLSHTKPINSDHNKIFNYIVNGNVDYAQGDVIDKFAFERLEAIHQAKTVTDEKFMVKLIQDYNLVREHIPTTLQKSLPVQEALLQKMPLTALIRNLGRMTASGLLAPMNANTKLVVEKLSNEKHLAKARIHPFNVLVALKVYQMGKGIRGSLSWSPVQQIVDALDDAFYASFKFVEPTNKNFMLAVDVSGSMTWGNINGAPGINPRVAAAAMALTTAKTEKNYVINGFSTNFVDLKISPKMRLDNVIDIMNRTRMGGTDCAVPMLHATKHKIPVDTFIIYTDNETWHGNIHPAKALENYRQKMGIPAKLITCAFTGGFSSIANPQDKHMLDLSGFDSAAPEVIREFSLGNI